MSTNSNFTPFAQSFFVDATQNPDGIFVTSVDVVFSSRDDVLPITCQLRPTVNGYPSSFEIYHGAVAINLPQNVNIVSGVGDDLPNLTDSTKYTRFTFPIPIHIPPGEHAMVFKTNSAFYQVFIAQMSKQILGSDRSVSEQPSVGSLFKSQNGLTWTAIQDQDLMFQINRASFKYNSPGLVELDNKAPALANVKMDAFFFHTEDKNFAPTSLQYNYKSTANAGALAATATTFMPNRNYLPDIRQVLTSSNGSFVSLTTMASSSEYVSPVVDSTRASLTGIEYIINNAALQNTNIVITNPGYGYTNASNITVTISAPTREANSPAGVGVTATAAVSNVYAGQIRSIYLTNPGSGYVESPTVTISGGGGANGAANIVGETAASGGNHLARYITRKVVLDSGFDATDLAVYLTANKQSGADIQVYYKVMASEDPDQNFDNKNWVRMIQASNYNTVSLNDDDYIEFKYIPTGAFSVPNIPISYTTSNGTFSKFKVFAIKICLASTSTVNPPSLKDMRAIALA